MINKGNIKYGSNLGFAYLYDSVQTALMEQRGVIRDTISEGGMGDIDNRTIDKFNAIAKLFTAMEKSGLSVQKDQSLDVLGVRRKDLFVPKYMLQVGEAEKMVKSTKVLKRTVRKESTTTVNDYDFSTFRKFISDNIKRKLLITTNAGRTIEYKGLQIGEVLEIPDVDKLQLADIFKSNQIKGNKSNLDALYFIKGDSYLPTPVFTFKVDGLSGLVKTLEYYSIPVKVVKLSSDNPSAYLNYVASMIGDRKYLDNQPPLKGNISLDSTNVLEGVSPEDIAYTEKHFTIGSRYVRGSNITTGKKKPKKDTRYIVFESKEVKSTKSSLSVKGLAKTLDNLTHLAKNPPILNEKVTWIATSKTELSTRNIITGLTPYTRPKAEGSKSKLSLDNFVQLYVKGNPIQLYSTKEKSKIEVLLLLRGSGDNLDEDLRLTLGESRESRRREKRKREREPEPSYESKEELSESESGAGGYSFLI